MNILVLGASGMLGNAMFRVLSEDRNLNVVGTIRCDSIKKCFSQSLVDRLVLVEDLENHGELVKLFEASAPEVVINCTALARDAAQDPLRSISILAILPQRLSRLCRLSGARLVQFSSDGVFSGASGGYSEDDFPDANDLYGISKILGEVREPHGITLRTSIIGHELQTKNGLLEWFLSQKEQCNGFSRVIFSGFPTVVLSQIIRDIVLPRHELFGIYNVASWPISKFELLKLICEQYKKQVVIKSDDSIVIDRTLKADRFKDATGYVSPDWRDLVRTMQSYNFGLARP